MELMTPVKTIGELDVTVRRSIYSLLEEADGDYDPALSARKPGLWEYYENLLGDRAILAFDGESKLAGFCAYDANSLKKNKSSLPSYRPLVMIISKSHDRQEVDRLLRERLDEIASTAGEIVSDSERPSYRL